MRRITPFALLLCFLQLGASAQNWEAFNSGKTYHYRSDTATLPDQSVHFDSTFVVGADSNFSVARRFRAGVDTSLRNLPMFCGREITFFPNGAFHFRNPINVALPTRAGLSASFTLDSITGLTAVVTQVYQRTVLGAALDSVKVFTTSALDSLVLSKAHGILEWPGSLGSGHFMLAGIQEDRVGDTLPGFDGFFQYKGGDVYYYESDYFQGDLIFQQEHYQVKMAVDSSLRGPTGLRVYWTGIVRTTSSLSGNVVNVSIQNTGGDFLLEDGGNGLVDKSHEEQLKVPNSMAPYKLPAPWATYLNNPSANSGNPAWDGLWTTMSYETVSGRTELHYGREIGATGWMYVGIGGDTCVPSNIDQQRAVMRSGLGVTHVEWGAFESFGYFDMVGAIIDGDTIGTVIPDTVLLSRDQALAEAVKLQVSPNPSSGMFTVRMEGGRSGQLRLVDLRGKTLRTMQTTGAETLLDLECMPAGIYLLRFDQGTSTKTVRVVLTR